MPNLLATAAVVGEAVLLAKAPTLRQDLDTTPLSFPAKIVACAWVLLLALPPSLPQPEHESCRTSVRYQASCQCFRICLFLPTATILLFDADQGDSWAALLLLFVIATTVLAQDLTSLAVAAHQQDVVADPLALLGLDLAPRPLFMAGLGPAQLFLLGAELLPTTMAFQLAASLLAPIWIFSFPFIFGPSGAPTWFTLCRLAAALVPFWGQVSLLISCWSVMPLFDLASASMCQLPGDRSGAEMVWWIGCGFLLASTVIATRFRQQEELRVQRQLAAEAKVAEIFSSLCCKGALLCRAGELDVASTFHKVACQLRLAESIDAVVQLPPALALAQLPEQLEAKMRVERLHKGFLADRQAWLQKLWIGRESYLTVAASASELLQRNSHSSSQRACYC